MFKNFLSEKKRNQILIFLGISLVLLALFYIFSFYVKGGRFKAFDFDMTVRLSDKTPKKYDPYFSLLSLTGSFELVLVILIILLFLRRKIFGFLAVGIFGFAHVVELFGKSFLNHPPPPFMFFRYDLGFQFPTSYVQTGNSYPSGHAMRMIFVFVIAVWIIFNMKKFNNQSKLLAIAPMFIYTCLMLLSRVVLGEHWTSDVIGGSILGASFGFLSLIFL